MRQKIVLAEFPQFPLTVSNLIRSVQKVYKHHIGIGRRALQIGLHHKLFEQLLPELVVFGRYDRNAHPLRGFQQKFLEGIDIEPRPEHPVIQVYFVLIAAQPPIVFLGQPRNFLNGENHVVFLIDFHFQQFLLNALRHIAVRGASGKLFLEQLRFRVSQILEIDRSYLFHQGIQYILL